MSCRGGPSDVLDSGTFVGELALFQRIVEQSACPLLVADATASDRPIVYASPAVERLTGYSVAEWLGRPWVALFDSSVPALEDAFERGREARVLLTARHQNGALLSLEARITRMRDELATVTHYIVALHDVTAEHRDRAALEYRAHHDPLTGLANRHLLSDRFDRVAAHARRYETTFALLLLDLNGFKSINNRYGHDAGDALLRHVSARLVQAVRAEDTVARLGGDEFVLLLADSESCESVEAVVGRVRDSLSRPLMLGSHALHASGCMGMARFPDDASELDALLKVADMRLYAKKARGRRALRQHAAPPHACSGR